jgi:uncharacterized membrane protein
VSDNVIPILQAGVATNDPIPLEDPIFTALITPHRSLSRRGLTLVMGFVGAVGLAVSVPFYLLGAWPVVGFMGLDVVLIYLAFRYNNQTARAYEEIVLTRIQLLFRKVSWRGKAEEFRFNPLWTRLERQDHPELGIEGLALVQGRARVEIASCLGREERADFADHFARALAESRR